MSPEAQPAGIPMYPSDEVYLKQIFPPDLIDSMIARGTYRRVVIDEHNKVVDNGSISKNGN